MRPVSPRIICCCLFLALTNLPVRRRPGKEPSLATSTTRPPPYCRGRPSWCGNKTATNDEGLYAGNRVPMSRFDPAVVKFLKLQPLVW
jgi:hypothetical protein